jgi:hypothetical protein
VIPESPPADVAAAAARTSVIERFDRSMHRFCDITILVLSIPVALALALLHYNTLSFLLLSTANLQCFGIDRQ